MTEPTPDPAFLAAVGRAIHWGWTGAGFPVVIDPAILAPSGEDERPADTPQP